MGVVRMAQVGHGGVHFAGRTRAEWVKGLVAFAGIMMILIGLFHVVMALTAIVRNSFYVVTPNYVFSFNVAVWGWLHLILGILVGLVGIALLANQEWARIVGMVLV